MTEQGLLSLTGVGKSFPGCIANDNIDLDVAAGEIHALLGENGAGKVPWSKSFMAYCAQIRETSGGKAK